MNHKIQKMFAAFTLLALLAVNAETTLAQQIPAGYALVPVSALGGMTPNFGWPQSATTNAFANASAPSAKYSTLRAEENFGFVNEQNLKLVATLRDETGEPLFARVVNLVGSRATDRVQTLQGTTDENGEAIFLVTGGEEGVATFTAIDQMTGTSITERPRIIFLKNSQAIGGDPVTLRANLLAQANTLTTPGSLTPSATTTNPVNYTKKIEVEFPTTAVVNTPQDIKVSITDNNGVVLEDFAGTVSFASNDPQAKLPKNYTYKNLDRGVHIFNNAVTFYTPGIITLRVTSDNETAPTDLTINVTGGVTNLAGAPVIETPLDNFVTNQPIVISGTATPNSNLAVLNDDQLVEQISSDSSGRFSAELKALTEGTHALKVGLLGTNNAVSAVSTLVNVTLDQTPPTLDNITFDPGNEVESGTKVVVKVQSEEDLGEVKLSVSEKSIVLKESEPGVYLGDIQTSKPNEYSFDLTLTDRAGNVTNLKQVAQLSVQLPITILNVNAESKSTRVNLSWDPPSNQPDVDHYLVKYGPTENNLESKFETLNNRASASIEQLNNNTTYYFQITSIDKDGKDLGQSALVNAVPTSLLELRARACDRKVIFDWLEQNDPNVVRYQIAYGVESGRYLENQNLPDARTHWEVRDLINDAPYYFTIRGLDVANNIVLDSGEEVSATPGGEVCLDAAGGPPSYPIQLWQKKEKDGQTILVWNATPNATSYRVYAGTEPNYFNLPIVTVTTPYLRPTGLDPEKNYYFAVRAVYENGESKNFSNVLEVKVGPALIAALSLMFALGATYVIQRRRKILE